MLIFFFSEFSNIKVTKDSINNKGPAWYKWTISISSALVTQENENQEESQILLQEARKQCNLKTMFILKPSYRIQ